MWGAASWFSTNVLDAVPGAGGGLDTFTVAGRNPFSFPAEQKRTFLDVGNEAGSPSWFRPCTPKQSGSEKNVSMDLVELHRSTAGVRGWAETGKHGLCQI